MTATTLTREIDLGPSIPRITVDLLSARLDEPAERCPVCLGDGQLFDAEWNSVDCQECGGTGLIGGTE